MFNITDFISLIKDKPRIAILVGVILVMCYLYKDLSDLNAKYEKALNSRDSSYVIQINNYKELLSNCNEENKNNKTVLLTTLNEIIAQQKEKLKSLDKLEQVTHKTLVENEKIISN